MHVFYGKDKFLDNCISVIELPRLSCPDYPNIPHDPYKVGQLEKMLEAETAAGETHYGAASAILGAGQKQSPLTSGD